MISALLTAVVGTSAIALLIVTAFRTLSRPVALGLAGALIVGAIAWPLSRASRVLRESSVPISLANVAYETSASCARCHPAHVRSWAATYHRTMTQEPHADSVLGDFSGKTVELEGGAARMFEEEGRFVMELLAVDRTVESGLELGRYTVDRLVGSHEMQVYLTRRPDGAYLTLPFEWNARDRRWVTSTGNFLQPPPTEGLLGHTAEWNSNCSFCHNTRVNPGQRTDDFSRIEHSAAQRRAIPTANTERYATTVEELGIACEACHGPGHEHVTRNASPVRRHVLRLAGRSDPSIVNPETLTRAKGMEVCGRCHGKWFPRDEKVEMIFTGGEPFVPGQSRLHEHYEDPLTQRLRGADTDGYFWPDATPRPTSMEYQGVLLSACHDRGAMDCSSCHSMHDAAPDDQLRFVDDPSNAAFEDDQMCTQCHEDIDSAAHSRHPAETSGSRCASCHMPYQTFGLMKAVRSHRVSIPSMRKTERDGMPNACTQCHVDRPLHWAAKRMDQWYGTDELAGLVERTPVPASVVELVRGHALTRALAAHALGATDAITDGDGGWRLRILGAAMDDPYAAVRKLAADSYRNLSPGPIQFDYLAPPATRRAQLEALDLPILRLPRGAHEWSLPALAMDRDNSDITVLE